jgi:glycosyltransferase involved in cell wall biosynthesis
MKVALVHDHLAQDGGAEKVLKVFSDMYPDAPIYTLLYEKKHIDKYFNGKLVETSIIQKLPWGIKRYQWYMPFMPMAVEFFDLRSFDLIISSSSAFSKGVITSPYSLHICYCHSPTRYVWDYTHQYIKELKYNKYIKKIISLALNYIRIWDKIAADRVDVYIANSKTVKNRIKKYYRRGSSVIYPPVEIDQFYISGEIGDYYLIGGRLAPYKRVDIVIEAFSQSGKRLKVYGDGIDTERLKETAKDFKNIEFLGRVDDKTKADLYSHAKAFIYPQEEDFGITAIESMASGRPVIAYQRGGATETVKENFSGVFFDVQTPAALNEAIEKFEKLEFDPMDIKKYADQFSVPRFKKEISDFIDKEFSNFKDELKNL